MRVSILRKELDDFKHWKVILNLSLKGWEHTDYTVEEFLSKYEENIPYECYEKIYDWDEFGAGDGHNVICFYSEGPGFLTSDPRAARAYSEEI